MGKQYKLITDATFGESWSGPHQLVSDETGMIAEEPGVYVLVSADDDGNLYARYVGRGLDVGERLGTHAATGKYEYFYYRHSASEIQAFKHECGLFHRFGKRPRLDNRVHPARPAGYEGPLCSSLGCNGEHD